LKSFIEPWGDKGEEEFLRYLRKKGVYYGGREFFDKRNPG